jgi:hypothetical protein
MHPDLEGVGGLVSAGLVAGEIDAVSMPKQAPAHAHGLCGNCGADVAGAYCSACGQSGHLHRSLWHLSVEFLHGVLHFDAKGYRTLPLLVGRPGVLTRRYIDGQRTRYVSPLALFLFCMFLVYFVFSLATEHGLDHSRIAEQDLGAAKADVARARQEIDASVAQAEAALEAARKSGSGVKEAEAELSEAKLGRSISSLSLGVANAAIARSDQADRTALAAADAGSPVPTWQEQLSSYAKEHGDASGLKGKWMRALSNPDLTLYKLKNTSYKFSFMLIPISLPFLWLLFAWRRGVAMYDHAVFFALLAVFHVAAVHGCSAHLNGGTEQRRIRLRDIHSADPHVPAIAWNLWSGHLLRAVAHDCSPGGVRYGVPAVPILCPDDDCSLDLEPIAAFQVGQHLFASSPGIAQFPLRQQRKLIVRVRRSRLRTRSI